MNENEIVDELRVIICEEEGRTAYFTFSSQIRPAIHQLRIYGPKNGLVLDQDHEILIRLRGQKSRATPIFSFPLHCLRSSILEI